MAHAMARSTTIGTTNRPIENPLTNANAPSTPTAVQAPAPAPRRRARCRRQSATATIATGIAGNATTASAPAPLTSTRVAVHDSEPVGEPDDVDSPEYTGSVIAPTSNPTHHRPASTSGIEDAISNRSPGQEWREWRDAVAAAMSTVYHTNV